MIGTDGRRDAGEESWRWMCGLDLYLMFLGFAGALLLRADVLHEVAKSPVNRLVFLAWCGVDGLAAAGPLVLAIQFLIRGRRKLLGLGELLWACQPACWLLFYIGAFLIGPAGGGSLLLYLLMIDLQYLFGFLGSVYVFVLMSGLFLRMRYTWTDVVGTCVVIVSTCLTWWRECEDPIDI